MLWYLFCFERAGFGREDSNPFMNTLSRPHTAAFSDKAPDKIVRPLVFVVNNNPDFLDLIRELLVDEGYRVSIENYGMDTLTHIVAARPDVAVLDVSPGTEQGFQLIAQMHGNADTHAIPVIVASTQPSLAERVMNDPRTPVVDYLPKPFDIHDLYSMLERVVGR